MMPAHKETWLDRAIAWMAPGWGRARARARMQARHFEAASTGRRTDGWHRLGTDANAAAMGATLLYLRAQARDLVRNNPWARRALRRIVTNTVGWGIRPKATGRTPKLIMERWRAWAETTQCDAAGRLNFYGLQKLAMRTIVESGEVLIRRRWRLPEDGLAVPMQLQVLEPDFIDTGRNGLLGDAGGPIIQGVEFDMLGRRAAYWLFDKHPGSIGYNVMSGSGLSPISRRIPADGVLHVFDQERPGQVRGPSWFASVDVRLHDFDRFEDATLMKQQIAACMAAFVTDYEGNAGALGLGGTDTASQQATDTFEPGMIVPLPPGKQITVANPPQANDHQTFSAAMLRGVAAGIGVTYEDLTGDYSQVNYSSARMGRLAAQSDIHDWRWHMLIPQMCQPAWQWMLDAMLMAGDEIDAAPAEWTPPPAQLLNPDVEVPAYQKAVRLGLMTWPEMIREQGHDPDAQLDEIEEFNADLDKRGIVLDCDPRLTNSSGQKQASGPAPTEPATSVDVPAATAKPDAAKPDTAEAAPAT